MKGDLDTNVLVLQVIIEEYEWISTAIIYVLCLYNGIP